MNTRLAHNGRCDVQTAQFPPDRDRCEMFTASMRSTICFFFHLMIKLMLIMMMMTMMIMMVACTTNTYGRRSVSAWYMLPACSQHNVLFWCFLFDSIAHTRARTCWSYMYMFVCGVPACVNGRASMLLYEWVCFAHICFIPLLLAVVAYDSNGRSHMISMATSSTKTNSEGRHNIYRTGVMGWQWGEHWCRFMEINNITIENGSPYMTTLNVGLSCLFLTKFIFLNIIQLLLPLRQLHTIINNNEGWCQKFWLLRFC